MLYTVYTLASVDSAMFFPGGLGELTPHSFILSYRAGVPQPIL